MNQVIEEKIAEFRAEVKNREVLDMVQRFITSGICYALNERAYIDLKQRIAAKYQVHHTQVLVVGSAKLGFSIAPGKRYQPFSETSDIDIAFVNDRLFDSIWYEVYKYHIGVENWCGIQEFRKYLFFGWIRPDKLPSSQYFPIAKEWWEFFRELTAEGVFGPYKIRGALYKSMNFLESYQEKCVIECKNHEVKSI
ncbi:MAG: hypothetical protein ABSA01_02525 [Anaerolineales bacterium]|jgi:hypothetical protein